MRARPLTPAEITGALAPCASGVHLLTTIQEGPAMPASRPPASTQSRITNLARIVPANGKPACFWVANLTVNQVTVRVHNRFGSWVIDRGVDGLRDLPASYAADLQDAVKAAERAEQRQAVVA
jgi:hypothetical protein